MRGEELIISATGVRREGKPARPHPLEAMIARLLRRLGLAAAEKAGPPVTVYVAEELLFAKQFTLPVKEAGVGKAVAYQLDLLLPFPAGSYLHAFTSERAGKETAVTLYAVPTETVEPRLRELAEAGHAIAGVFPESQRYVGRTVAARKSWGLLLPGSGDTATLLAFANGRLQQRHLCAATPTLEEAKALCGGEEIFHPAPPAGSGFGDGAALLAEPPAGRDFDLLPAGYRRPDYLKRFALALAAFNLVMLLLLIGLKEYRFQTASRQVDAQIAALQPEIKQINGLASQEEAIRKDIARLEELSKNPNLLALLGALTSKLPPSAYLDQLRLEKKDAAILYLDGYADDMGALSEGLKGLGEVRLKSTSRRNNKNYFLLEITLP
ncbi:MAG: hypothetical protein ACOY3Z_01085 [Thermodesulfobacteriota bacterium]